VGAILCIIGYSSGEEIVKPEILNETGVDTAVSNRSLQTIVEQGFFGAPGSLARARAACAELLFAREVIKAQTSRIAQLNLSAAQT
jgi:hypothetical protein